MMIRTTLLASLLTLASLHSVFGQEAVPPAVPASPAPSVAVPVQDTPADATPAPAAVTPAPEVRAAENPNHDELRALLTNIMGAMNKKDVEGIIPYLHPQIVFATMNGDVAKGHQGIRDYFAKMMTGPQRVVDNVTMKFTASELTTLYQNDTMGICHGTTQDAYTLAGGKKMDINATWTATMVKENGKWLVSSIHYSANIFNNPVLTAVQKTMMMVGMGCAVVGLLLGMMIGRKTAGRR